ncbi:M15 family metallopeptidase [Stackebrandtia soli]|uniref:M15 family metallopeptidase n=1 Tax=Stackebrandtia soli TaxID=1892856 RepID=UPI0039E8CC77
MTFTLLADPDITRLPVLDCGEPLVRLADHGIRCLPGTGELGRLARLGVARRLSEAQQTLPDGLRFVVSEGHRSAAAQQEIITAYTAFLQTEHPDASRSELERLSSRFVSPIGVAPHVAGAAVDITIEDSTGEQLWMGTPIDATPEASDGACYTEAIVDAVARRNRDTLTTALESVGFVNYPTEWWHFSYGDRYWAHRTGAAHAIYGPCAARPTE